MKGKSFHVKKTKYLMKRNKAKGRSANTPKNKMVINKWKQRCLLCVQGQLLWIPRAYFLFYSSKKEKEDIFFSFLFFVYNEKKEKKENEVSIIDLMSMTLCHTSGLSRLESLAFGSVDMKRESFVLLNYLPQWEHVCFTWVYMSFSFSFFICLFICFDELH